MFKLKAIKAKCFDFVLDDVGNRFLLQVVERGRGIMPLSHLCCRAELCLFGWCLLLGMKL